MKKVLENFIFWNLVLNCLVNIWMEQKNKNALYTIKSWRLKSSHLMWKLFSLTTLCVKIFPSNKNVVLVPRKRCSVPLGKRRNVSAILGQFFHIRWFSISTSKLPDFQCKMATNLVKQVRKTHSLAKRLHLETLKLQFWSECGELCSRGYQKVSQRSHKEVGEKTIFVPFTLPVVKFL